MTDVDLEQELERHRTLRDALPCSWSAFFARFGRLRPIQIAAIPEILAGKDLMITAPTAGGKTEAVVAPVCERLIREQWKDLSCILVTPTRALVNDLYERLSRPVSEMKIEIGRKTADHAMSESKTEQFLITTPESLESMLTFRRERLDQLRCLILDEIHLLDCTSRGDQLRSIIGRLRLYLASLRQGDIPLQVIALSATLPNARKTAERYLGAHAEIVSVVGQRSIESAVIVAGGGDQRRAEAAVQATEQFDDVRKMLVFCNSRKAVDSAGHFFQTQRFASAALHCHHGSLAKAERETAEQRFKQDHFAVCVATMTLEIGIDIGDVDLVVCMSPPSGIASFLQRIGRGCRRLQGKTRVLCVARDRAEELIFQAMIQAAQQPIPDGPRPPFRRSVLIQQVLAYLRQVDKYRRTYDQLARALTHSVTPQVDHDILRATLKELCDSGLVVEQRGIYEPGSAGWDFIQSSRIYANIANPVESVQIVDADTGKRVSTAAAISTDDPGRVRVAGRSYKVVDQRGSQVLVRGTKDSILPPDYGPRSFSYAYDVGVSLSEMLGCRHPNLLALQSGDAIFVMTWLGKLQNQLLASAAKHLGISAIGSCFAIQFSSVHAGELLDVLKRTIEVAKQPHQLDALKVEQIVDLGPHLKEFSSAGQVACRRDWSDPSFLDRWLNGLTKIDMIDMSDSRAIDYLVLASV